MTKPVYYVTIGNSDNKLTQGEWADFWGEVDASMAAYAHVIHGAWMSLPNSHWQNACWCIEVTDDGAGYLRAELTDLAKKYRQDSIAWTEGVTEFLEP